MPADENQHPRDAQIPEYFNKYLENLRANDRTYSEEAELDACRKILKQIDQESNEEIKQFMEETLKHYCQDSSMLISYILETLWRRWVKEQKNLQKQVQPLDLFIALESILANQCDSSGYTKTYGQPRYRLTIPGNHTSETRTRTVDASAPRAGLAKSYYQLGVHRFLVGQAIIEIVDLLENRYGLDFEELERARPRTPEHCP